MTGQYIAASTMFLITVGITSIFCYPAVKFAKKSELMRFYWVGFWAFLGGISSLAGAQAVLNILGLNVDVFASAILTGITAAFIFFVVFAWARLSLFAIGKIKQKSKHS